MHEQKSRKGCGYSRILKQDQKDNSRHKIFTWKPKSGENHGGNNGAKIHYDRSEYKTISKVSQKRSIQERDKDLKQATRSKE